MDDDTFLGNSFEDEDNQGLANLDEVTNYENFDQIPPQEHATFWYSNKNKSNVVEWETTQEDNVHQSGRPPAAMYF